jgi:hypothetical protein
MAAVFLMQSLGQLAAALVGLVVLLALGSQKHLQDIHLDDAVRKRWVDTIWRSVIGAGVVRIPGLLISFVLLLQFTLEHVLVSCTLRQSEEVFFVHEILLQKHTQTGKY